LGSFRRQQRLNLALEGGGAHGAFTWGVLDRLLEDETLDLAWISAPAPAPSMRWPSPPALPSQGRPARAPSCGGVGGGGQGRPARPAAAQSATGRHQPLATRMAQVATMFSPYDFNPLGFDPFRKLLEAHIDFALLRTTRGPELADRRDRRHHRSAAPVPAPRDCGESVLASPACRPSITRSPSTGQAYWDGGFSPTRPADRGAREARSPIR
jgi:NTE family protein